MGKRELLLIVGFVMAGVVVYQLSAPAAQPGQGSFSWARIVDEFRREIRGTPGRAEVVTEDTVPLDPEVTELRLDTGSAEVTVTGSNRRDLGYQLKVRSTGADEAEARTFAARVKLLMVRSADSLVIDIDYPPEARQWATLTLDVPEGLGVRVQPNRSQLTLTNLASVELVEARGTATLKQISGRATVYHRGGELTIADVGSLRLKARGSDVRITGVADVTALQLEAGELRGERLAGPIEVEANETELRLEGFEDTRGPLRITLLGGSASLFGLINEARIDARYAEVDVTLARPAPVAIFAEGEEDLDVGLPPGGYDLDALVTRGRLALPENLQERMTATPQADGHDRRAAGAVNGGGPTITLRANRGNVVLRNPGPTSASH